VGAAAAGSGASSSRPGGRVHLPNVLKARQKSTKQEMASGMINWMDQNKDEKKQAEKSIMLSAKAQVDNMKFKEGIFTRFIQVQEQNSHSEIIAKMTAAGVTVDDYRIRISALASTPTPNSGEGDGAALRLHRWP